MTTYQLSSLDDLRAAVADGPLAWQVERLIGKLRRRDEDGAEPLGFIAQIRLETVAGLVPGLPASGLVSVFLTVEHMGCDDPEGWQVLYTPDCSDLVRLPMPAELAEEFSDAAVALAPRARISLPSNSSDAFYALGLSDEQQEAYGNLPWLEDPDEGGDHRLLGWAHEWQGNLHTTVAGAAAEEWDVPDEPDEWVLLLQVDSCDEPEMYWGDGAGYFMIRREDLAAARFDQVVHEMHAL